MGFLPTTIAGFLPIMPYIIMLVKFIAVGMLSVFCGCLQEGLFRGFSNGRLFIQEVRPSAAGFPPCTFAPATPTGGL